MSKWHALDGVTHDGEVLAGVDVIRWPRIAILAQNVAVTDGLADPDGDELATAHVALLPKGAAWATPDDAPLPTYSNLWKFFRSLTEPFVDAYRDIWGVAMASTSVTITSNNVLEDWETEYGLPDPCLGVDQTFSERLKWLQFKVQSIGTITPGDFLNLAAEVGHDIIIEEPEFFELGSSDCGGPYETGSPEMEHTVIVWPVNAGEYGFEVGGGQLGATPLYDFDAAEVLECLLPGLISSGYRMIFSYSYNNEFSQQA